ncbi:MAG: carnitine 3-dehydrogenase [Rhodobacteraceae bacterium]|nr:carnitine 3-dehydrogenase [Paracoccaceae bacterium]
MGRKIAAIIGGGVIGGGWAARFILSGWQVRLYDPDPASRETVLATCERARQSYPALYDVMLPPEGEMSFHSDPAEAVRDAEWIQESVPERLSLKHSVYAEIQKHCPDDAIIASSTSGFKPSDLQAGTRRPGQLIVAHPYNPVYLLPVVELVPSAANSAQFSERAADILRRAGMYPALLRAEIDAHIGDRLLEAVWREALWLLHDDTATTEEIDTIITHGFGLRWAQMGLFETYRIAGGKAGMTHFIEQFGPCLKFPWTRLMDTPELDSALAAKIGRQSDRQSGRHSIDELERIRDANLVTMLRGLKQRRWGAGQHLLDVETQLNEPTTEFTAPMITIRRIIPVDWIDYNGHVNEARYLEIFSLATDAFLAAVGCDQSYVASGKSYFTLETHIRHRAEAYAGDAVLTETLCLSAMGRKLHLMHILRNSAGTELASGEHLLLHIDLKRRKSSTPDKELEAKLSHAAARHSRDMLPAWAQPILGFSS